MGSDFDRAQGTEVFTLAVVLALTDGAADGFVCSHFFLPPRVVLKLRSSLLCENEKELYEKIVYRDNAFGGK